jgi:hypothetical protein
MVSRVKRPLKKPVKRWVLYTRPPATLILFFAQDALCDLKHCLHQGGVQASQAYLARELVTHCGSPSKFSQVEMAEKIEGAVTTLNISQPCFPAR